MTYVIAQPCVDVKDKSCIEECPVDCIYEGGRALYIQPDECVEIEQLGRCTSFLDTLIERLRREPLTQAA